MSRMILATLGACLVLVAPVAQAQNVTSFTQANVIEALAALGVEGARADNRDNGDGTVTQAVAFEAGGLKRVGVITACSEQAGCLGLYLLTIWSSAGSISRETINAANLDWPFGKAFIAANGALIYARYIISDGGITRPNLQANIGVYVNATESFVRLMQRQDNSVGTDDSVALSGSDVGLSPIDNSLVRVIEPEDVNPLRRSKPARTGDLGLHVPQ